MRALVLIASLFFALPAASDSRSGMVQFCWALGALDNTVYYAEAVERDDRSASFGELLDISGIENNGINCVRSAITAHETTKLSLLKLWRVAALEAVNTTFMSDLDY